MNEQNLRPGEYKFSQEDAKKGREKSAETRRRNKDMKTIFNLFLKSPVPNEQVAALLESYGYEPNTNMAIALGMIMQAIKGNVKAFDAIMKYSGQDKLREETIKQLKGGTSSGGATGDVSKLIEALSAGAAQDWAGAENEQTQKE